MAAALLVGLDLRGALGALRYAFVGLGPGLRAAVALEEVRAAATSAAHADVRASRAQAESTESGLSFRGVDYTYPDSTVAIKGVDLHLAPGTVVALVGENGAGKSTLVELALGLRHPGSGSVSAPGGARTTIAQRFARYEVSLAEAVLLDRVEGTAHDAEVFEMLGRASPRPFGEHLPDGAARQLGARWPDGQDLSEGQWQIVAGARAFAQTARVAAFDEPTSALDPEAQEIVTEKYLTHCRHLAHQGGIALIVTHRLAIPHQADVIVVMEKGRVVEIGSHPELLAAAGPYSAAYAAATEGFRAMESSP